MSNDTGRRFTVQVTFDMAKDAIMADALREARAVMHHTGHSDAVVTPLDGVPRGPLETAIRAIDLLRSWTQDLRPADHKRMVADLAARGIDMQRTMRDLGEILNVGRGESIAKVLADVTAGA